MSREHGELLAHVRGLAVGAIHCLAVPDELLEVRLALHAHVLVDRHRRGSLGMDPDASQNEVRLLPALTAEPLELRVATG